MEIFPEIYEVAIYLRRNRDKSNGEYDVLDKHEKELIQIALYDADFLRCSSTDMTPVAG